MSQPANMPINDPTFFERHAREQAAPHFPFDLELERDLLAGLIGGIDIEPVILERLKPIDFWDKRHEALFDALLELHAQDVEITNITVRARMEQRGQVDLVDGGLYITDLLARPAVSFQVRGTAILIRDKAERRRYLASLGEAAKLAHDESQPFDIQYDRAEHLLGQCRPFNPNKEFVFGANSTDTHETMLKEQAQAGGWLPMPWMALAERAPVINQGDLVVIVGPEGSGKSAKLMNWAEFYAGEHQVKTVYIHTEMNKSRVFNRRLAANSKVPYTRLVKPEELGEGDWKMIVQAGVEMEQGMLQYLNYWHPETVDEDHLFGIMQRMVDDHGTRVFVLDYLNDVVPEKIRGQNEASAWQRLLARMEAFNNKNDTVIVTAAQLNRDGGAYQIGRALKQKAALYIKLEPEQLEHELIFEYDGLTYQYVPGDFKPAVRCRVEKFRDGGRGVYELLFVGPRFLWVDVPVGFDDGRDDPGAYDDSVFRGSKD